MKQTYTILSTLLLAFLLSVPTFAQEATQAAEPVPTVETVAPSVPTPVSEPITDNGFFTALFNSDVIWQVITVIAMLLLFRSVPQSTIDKLKAEAAKTDNPADDIGAKILEFLNANPSLIPDLFKRDTGTTTVTTGNGTDTTITVSQPPVVMYPAPVGNTGTSTTDVSTPPFVPMPETPREEIKYLHPYETRLDFGSRQVHVPVNMAYVFENKNGAGQDYPHPNVNINAAYGARFDIAFIAGSWGFTYLTGLAKNVQYKVIVDYSAEVTGKHLDSLPEWLWWELEVSSNGKPGLKTGVNQAIMNGAAHTAEWGITGTGEPVFLTPRIRALWASALDNSAINWHSLRVVPVDYGLAG